jgi:hypothetical protein
VRIPRGRAGGGTRTAEARLLWHHILNTLFRWWMLRQQGRDLVVRGLERLRVGVKELLELPGARWMAHLG